ncbi:MAG: ribonuclease III [Clostridia bacterium]|jgi:ribonuclease-3 family protein|nr:ribonuclease III [Clostridia bacterium]
MDVSGLKPNELSTPSLAYLGDCVMELCVRTRLLQRGFSTSRDLNAEALRYVRAGAQADAVERILPVLSEQEAAVYRRGRNIGHTNVPKSATVAQYRMATGLEVLFGYLYVTGQQSRIDELFLLAYEPMEQAENK